MSDLAPTSGSVDDSCMRIFINDLANQGKRLSVRCNGVELQRVTEYDVAKGYAIVHDLKDGRPYAVGDRVATRRVEGEMSVAIVRR